MEYGDLFLSRIETGNHVSFFDISSVEALIQEQSLWMYILVISTLTFLSAMTARTKKCSQNLSILKLNNKPKLQKKFRYQHYGELTLWPQKLGMLLILLWWFHSYMGGECMIRQNREMCFAPTKAVIMENKIRTNTWNRRHGSSFQYGEEKIYWQDPLTEKRDKEMTFAS